MAVEAFLNKDIQCEVPYYIPRGIPFQILTSKAREVFQFLPDPVSGAIRKQAGNPGSAEFAELPRRGHFADLGCAHRRPARKWAAASFESGSCGRRSGR
ncbi:unnamed protein product [Amoebophrya sp. A25]|nr:unnamed protein product [Amoebophrya sp. A25]|eukprot:GSA25T00012244001.1